MCSINAGDNFIFIILIAVIFGMTLISGLYRLLFGLVLKKLDNFGKKEIIYSIVEIVLGFIMIAVFIYVGVSVFVIVRALVVAVVLAIIGLFILWKVRKNRQNKQDEQEDEEQQDEQEDE